MEFCAEPRSYYGLDSWLSYCYYYYYYYYFNGLITQTQVGLCGHGLDYTNFGWILAMAESVGLFWHYASNNNKNNLEFNTNLQKLKYTNADFKIFLYALIHITIMPWDFRIFDPNNSWVMHPSSLYFS